MKDQALNFWNIRKSIPIHIHRVLVGNTGEYRCPAIVFFYGTETVEIPLRERRHICSDQPFGFFSRLFGNEVNDPPDSACPVQRGVRALNDLHLFQVERWDLQNTETSCISFVKRQ